MDGSPPDRVRSVNLTYSLYCSYNEDDRACTTVTGVITRTPDNAGLMQFEIDLSEAIYYYGTMSLTVSEGWYVYVEDCYEDA